MRETGLPAPAPDTTPAGVLGLREPHRLPRRLAGHDGPGWTSTSASLGMPSLKTKVTFLPSTLVTSP